MSNALVTIRDLTYTYPGSPEPVFRELNATLPKGFTGVLGANGAGKSTLLNLIKGELSADSGSITGSDSAVLCEQRTDLPPKELDAFLLDDTGAAWEIRGRMNIPFDVTERWSTLSHGERKRTQIAAALWRSPDVLFIDEPSNHIDASTRKLLLEALRGYTGIGVLVSHDRVLLDALCEQCLWLEAGNVQRFPGNYTQASETRALQIASANAHYQQSRKELDRLKTEAHHRREKAARADRDRSKRGIAAKDSDSRERIDRARVTGKDGVAGKQLNQLSGRMAQAQGRVDQARFSKELDSNIWLGGKAAPKEHLYVGEPGVLPIAKDRKLKLPLLEIRRTDRIVLTGDNGLGKTTLVRHLLDRLTIDKSRLVYLPQELSEEEGGRVLEDVKALDKATLGHLMQIVKRLGSSPERLLDSSTPSPGELRKTLLSLGLVREPWLIVLDEPTNHLDLPSIEALTNALIGCPCALLMVTHDEALATAVATTEWRLKVNAGDESCELIVGSR